MRLRRQWIPNAGIPPGAWLTLAFTVLVSLMLWSSFDLSRAAAWIPRIILGFTLAVLLLRLALEIGRAPGQEPVEARGKAPVINSGSAVHATAAIGWISLLLLAAWLFGVAPGSALFCAIWLRLHARESWGLSLLVAGTTGAVLWLLFAVLPGSALYSGILWAGLGGLIPTG